MDLCEYEAYRKNSSQRHPWELARLRFVASLFWDYREMIPRNSKRVADIGCGDGFVTRRMAADFPSHEFVGVDIHLDAGALNRTADNRDRRNLSYTSSLGSALDARHTVGCVLLLDVLEHLKEDTAFIGALSKNPAVANGALFVLMVPAFKKLFSNHDRMLRHYRRYNLSEMKCLAWRAGLGVVEGGYIFLIPLMGRFLEALAQRFRPVPKAAASDITTWNRGKGLTRALLHLLYYDALFSRRLHQLGFLIGGLSCYLICRKPL